LPLRRDPGERLRRGRRGRRPQKLGLAHHPACLTPGLPRVPLRRRPPSCVGQPHPGCLGAERRPSHALAGNRGDDVVVVVHHPPKERRSRVTARDGCENGSALPVIVLHVAHPAAAFCERRSVPIGAERQQSDGLAPGQSQADARPAPEATDMVGVQMDQCTDGAFRAGRRQRLLTAIRSRSVLSALCYYTGYVTAAVPCLFRSGMILRAVRIVPRRR